MKRTSTALATLLLAACHSGPPSGHALEEQLRVALNGSTPDPQSVQFRNLYRGKVYKSIADVCGELNAKDVHGSYTGYRPFEAIWMDEPLVAPGKQKLRIMMIDNSGKHLGPTFCEISRSVEQRGLI